MLKFRIILITTIFLFVLNACKKNETTSNENPQLLQRIIYSEGDSIFYTFLTYDENKRLISIADSDRNGHTANTSIEYNLHNQIVKMKKLYRDDPGGIIKETTYSLIYNTNNQVIKKLWLSDPNIPNKTVNTYSYDSKGRLIADTVYNHLSEDVYSYTALTYDGDDNNIQWQSFTNSPSGFQSPGVITASYNTNLVPYHNLGLPTYFIRGNNFYFNSGENFLSRNNYIQVKYYDGTKIDYSYQYYSNGLPQKVVLIDSRGGPFSTDTIEFFYN